MVGAGTLLRLREYQRSIERAVQELPRLWKLTLRGSRSHGAHLRPRPQQGAHYPRG